MNENQASTHEFSTLDILRLSKEVQIILNTCTKYSKHSGVVELKSIKVLKVDKKTKVLQYWTKSQKAETQMAFPITDTPAIYSAITKPNGNTYIMELFNMLSTSQDA